MSEEIWKDLIGYEGRYAVSSEGRIKSYNYKGHNGVEKIINGALDSHGYLRFTAYIDSKNFKFISISRAVATMFIPNPENKPYVDHIDGNPLNNKVANLRWATHKENLSFPLAIEHFRQSKSAVSKPIYATKNGIKKWFPSATRFAKENHLSRGSCFDILKGRKGRKSVNGFTLEYASES